MDIDARVKTVIDGWKRRRIVVWNMSFEDVNWLCSELPHGDVVTKDLLALRNEMLELDAMDR